MKTKIETLLKNTLPKETNIIVRERQNCFGGDYIMIAFATSTHQINNVTGQFPDVVSFALRNNNTELEIQSYGCCGGQSIYIKPDKTNEKEKYLAMARVRIPFRKPKPEEKFILSAIKRFAEKWLQAIKDNEERLNYTDIVDYKPFLSH